MAIQAWYNPAEQKILAQKIAELIEPLTEAEMLNLEPFMPKMPEPFGEILPAAPETGGIVDLGEIEIELDDLDWDDMDLVDEDGDADGTETTAEPDTVPAPEAPPIPDVVEDEAAAMFLDIDGALAPMVHEPGMARIDVPYRGAIAYHPEVLARAALIPARQVWLSSWVSDAPKHLGHLLPRAVEAMESGSDDTGWWKIDAALAWLAANPLVRRVVWLDDELSEEDFVLGVSYRDIAADAFRAAGVKAMFTVPDPDTGLTVDMLEEAAAFLAAEESPLLELEAPAPAPGPVDEDPAGDDDWDFDADKAGKPETGDAAPEPAEINAVADWDPREPEPAPAPADEEEDDPFALPSRPVVRTYRADDDDPFADPRPRRRTPDPDEDSFA